MEQVPEYDQELSVNGAMAQDGLDWWEYGEDGDVEVDRWSIDDDDDEWNECVSAGGEYVLDEGEDK